MSTNTIRDQIIHQLDSLSPEEQALVLDYMHRVRMAPPGTPGDMFLAHVGDFDFQPSDIEEMMQAIEEGCERIDWDEWG